MRTDTRRSTRDRAVDVACVTLAVLVAAVVLMTELEARRASGAYLLVSTALAVVGCGALWWRRRWPVEVAVLLLILSVVTEFVGGALMVALFTVIVRRRWQVAVALSALSGLAVVPYSVLRPDPELGTFGFNVLNVALLTVMLVWGTRIRVRRELVHSLRERAARAEAEAKERAEQLRSQERESIAREMHDALAHRISLVSLHAGALEIRPDLPVEEVAKAAGTIRASAHQALQDLREILGMLRVGEDGPGLRPQPSLADVAGLVAEVRSAGTPVDLDDRLPDIASLPSLVSRTAYRVIQEGLTNACKHAPAREVRMLLERTSDSELHVWLRNRLASAPTVQEIPGSRSGLVGLSERVGLAGGRLDHGARRGPDGAVDFHLEAWMPWPT